MATATRRRRHKIDPDLAAAKEAKATERKRERLSIEATWRKNVLEPGMKRLNNAYHERASQAIAAQGGDKLAVDWASLNREQFDATLALYATNPLAPKPREFT